MRKQRNQGMSIVLQMSLSNPEEASVAPLGWNLQQ